jgi:thymidylate synthase (FAD)
MQVLDKGFVELEDFMGGDLRVVNSAKVSFAKRSTEVGDSERKLINYLMKHRHGSPFEHSYFTFHVKAPIFVVREWMRHRIGSFNEMSGRYVEFEAEFYVPDRWRIPAATNKQGSVLPEPLEGWDEAVTETFKVMLEEAYRHYKYLMELGIAKEMDRMILPLSLYTEFYWTVNARSLMNFLSLRLGPDAQWEIQQYAYTIDRFFTEKMPATWASWVENNQLAP